MIVTFIWLIIIELIDCVTVYLLNTFDTLTKLVLGIRGTKTGGTLAIDDTGNGTTSTVAGDGIGDGVTAVAVAAAAAAAAAAVVGCPYLYDEYKSGCDLFDRFSLAAAFLVDFECCSSVNSRSSSTLLISTISIFVMLLLK